MKYLILYNDNPYLNIDKCNDKVEYNQWYTNGIDVKISKFV